MGAKEVQFKPQEMIFEEGSQSKHLYYIKSGMIRIFKPKNEGHIEIDTLRAGQMLGELSFLDDQPRSASAEALTSCELIEISRSALDEAMSKLPEWFVAMTRTITGRLRNATNRIRAAEALTTTYETDQYGNRSKEYVFINTSELLRFSTSLLAVASRYGKNASTEGIEFSSDLLEKFAGQILQVPTAKVISLIELFKEVEILKDGLFLTDIRFLDQFIQFINDQNLVESDKKRVLTSIGFSALKLAAKNIAHAKSEGTLRRLNIAPALTEAGIQPTHLQELMQQGFVQSVLINSATDITIDFDPTKLVFEYRTFWVLNAIDLLNEQKRKA